MAPRFIEKLGLNSREQRLVSILGVVVLVMLVLGVPLGIQTAIWSRRADNEKTRAALDAVQGARLQIRERRAKKDAVAQRYARRAPALAGFLEQSARAQKLEVTDSVDRPDVPQGKRTTERSTVIHLKKAGMYAIAKFLESLEQSGDAVSVSRLNIRKRSGEPDSYDVEVGVSAFDRKELPPPTAPAASGSAAGKTDGKAGKE